MSKRKYDHIQRLLPVIKEKLADGMSQKEIELELGLTGDRPIHNLLKRERKGTTGDTEDARSETG